MPLPRVRQARARGRAEVPRVRHRAGVGLHRRVRHATGPRGDPRHGRRGSRSRLRPGWHMAGNAPGDRPRHRGRRGHGDRGVAPRGISTTIAPKSAGSKRWTNLNHPLCGVRKNIIVQDTVHFPPRESALVTAWPRRPSVDRGFARLHHLTVSAAFYLKSFFVLK